MTEQSIKPGGGWDARRDAIAVSGEPEAAAGGRLPACLPGIDLEAALKRVVGDHRLLRSLLVQFGRDHAGTLGRLRDDIAAGHYQGAERRAHLLKGVAGNLAAVAVAAGAQAMLDALRHDNHEGLPELLARLERELGTVLEACAGLVEEAGDPAADGETGAAPAASAAELQALFEELKILLRSGNTRAEHSAERLFRACGCPSQAGSLQAGSLQAGQWREMREAIAGFNFNRALAILDELKAGLRG